MDRPSLFLLLGDAHERLQLARYVLFRLLALPIKQLAQVVIYEVDGARVERTGRTLHQLAALAVVSDGDLAGRQDVDAELDQALLVQPVLDHACVEPLARLDALAPRGMMMMVRQFELLADEGAARLDDLLEHGWVVELLAVGEAFELELAELLLSGDQLQHAVEEVVTWEDVQASLSVPVFSRHIEASLLFVVPFKQFAHHIEPAAAPLHLVDAKILPERSHIFLEIAEVVSVEFNELAQLVRLQEQT